VKFNKRHVLMAYNFTNSFEWSIVSPFLPIFFYELVGNSFLMLSVVNSLPAILSVVMGLIWARISDSYGKRKPFILLSIATGIITTFLLSYVEDAWQLILLRISGVFTGAAGGAAFSALLSNTFKEKRGRMMGFYNALGLLGGISGNLLSAYFYDNYGMRATLQAVAVAKVIPLALVLIIKEEPEKQGKIELRRAVREAFKFPRLPPSFWRVYAVRCVLVLPGALGGSILAVYFVKFLGGSDQLWALITAVTTLMGIAVIPYGYLADKVGARTMFTLAGLGWTVLYAGYYLSRDPYIFALFFVIPVWPAFHVTYQKTLMDVSDYCERATLFATEGLISTIYGSIVGLIGGYLADVITPKNLLALSSALALLGAVTAYLLLREEALLRGEANP